MQGSRMRQVSGLARVAGPVPERARIQSGVFGGSRPDPDAPHAEGAMLQLAPHQGNDRRLAQPELLLYRLKRGPVLPRHFNDARDIGCVQQTRCSDGGQAAFFTQALHQAFAATTLPANSGQGPVASLALAWYSTQLAQFWPATYLGYFLTSVLLPSVL